jgi:hypothetical protein
MRCLASLLALGTAAMAMETLDAAYFGLVGADGVSEQVATKYSQCLQNTMSSRGAVAFVASESVLDYMNNLKSDDGCDRACQSKLAEKLDVEGVLSGSLKKNKDGFMTTLQIIRPDSNAKVEIISWQIVGTEKELMADGCKNGAGVVYNYLATPPTVEHPRWPKGFDLVKARESALNKGDVMKLVEELREEASRGNAMNNTNPDADKSGRSGR